MLKKETSPGLLERGGGGGGGGGVWVCGGAFSGKGGETLRK